MRTRTNTQQIFDRLSHGEFLAADSTIEAKRRLYNDIEDNFDDYRDYFLELGLKLEGGNGYYYFSRQENKQALEDKLQRFSHWIDVVDFLKSFDLTFSPGFQFHSASIEAALPDNVVMREKARKLYPDIAKSGKKIKKLVAELEAIGFAECIDEVNEQYKVTSAFNYIEELVNLITIFNEDETPEQ